MGACMAKQIVVHKTLRGEELKMNLFCYLFDLLLVEKYSSTTNNDTIVRAVHPTIELVRLWQQRNGATSGTALSSDNRFASGIRLIQVLSSQLKW